MTANSAQVEGFFGPNLDPDVPIYRIYPQRFLSKLLRGRFVVRSTHTWTDPWERLVSMCSYTDQNRQAHSLGDYLLPEFGQCWSLCHESDALWRIYSEVNQEDDLRAAFDGREAVRLRTTVRKLLNGLVAGVMQKGGSCFIAKVNYFEDGPLLQELTNRIGSDRENAVLGAARQADARLFKRNAFAHEQEVRLLYVDTHQEFAREEQIEISVDPNSFIEEITIDPRILAGEQEAYRTNWIRNFGFKNDVNRSLLYLGVMLSVQLFNQEELACPSNSITQDAAHQA